MPRSLRSCLRASCHMTAPLGVGARRGTAAVEVTKEDTEKNDDKESIMSFSRAMHPICPAHPHPLQWRAFIWEVMPRKDTNIGRATTKTKNCIEERSSFETHCKCNKFYKNRHKLPIPNCSLPLDNYFIDDYISTCKKIAKTTKIELRSVHSIIKNWKIVDNHHLWGRNVVEKKNWMIVISDELTFGQIVKKQSNRKKTTEELTAMFNSESKGISTCTIAKGTWGS